MVTIGRAIGLPDDFLALKAGSKGGGVIQVNLEFPIFFTVMLSNFSKCIRIDFLCYNVA